MLEHVSRMSFRKKLLYSYFSLVILSAFIMMLISGASMMRTGRQREIERIENGFAQSMLSIDNYMNRYVNLAYTLKVDSFLTNYLSKHYPAGTTVEKRYYDYFAVIKTYKTRMLYEQLSGNSISVYTDNSELAMNNDGFILPVTEKIQAMAWYQNTLKEHDGVLLSGTFDQEGGDALFFTMHLTPKAGSNNVLLVRILVRNINGLFNAPTGNRACFLVDDKGMILVSQQEELIGRSLEEAGYGFLTDRLSAADETNEVLEHGKKVYMLGRVCRDKGVSPCYLIEETALSSDAQAFLANVRSCLIPWFVVIGIDILVILLVAGQFSKRISALIEAVNQVANRKSDSFHVLDGSDEFSTLSRYINEMITKVQYCQKETYQAKLDTKNAQIRALRSQINPHFLFNCLQSIQASALKNGAMETADLISMYSRVIRESISWKQEVIPLGQELGLIESYLQIQKKRFEKQLICIIDVEEACRNAQIPKFTLQPIVENAIHHGMQGCAHPLELTIHISRAEDELRLVVRDNGKGMSGEQLQEIHQLLEGDLFTDPQVHIGIVNLQQRIWLRYGRAYGIRIASSPDAGTEVDIRLPFEIAAGEDAQNQT